MPWPCPLHNITKLTWGQPRSSPRASNTTQPSGTTQGHSPWPTQPIPTTKAEAQGQKKRLRKQSTAVWRSHAAPDLKPGRPFFAQGIKRAWQQRLPGKERGTANISDPRDASWPWRLKTKHWCLKGTASQKKVDGCRDEASGKPHED